MKVHQAIAKTLNECGIDTMFGLMGDGNMYMVDSFIRTHGGRFIAGAHESGGAIMALGYSAISGKLGVCTVTHGPAVTNTVTALVEGVKSSTPMLLLCGDTDKRDRENPQNVVQRDFVVTSGAGFEQLRSPATIAEDLQRAIRRAIVERRPIALNIPAEFDWEEATFVTPKIYLPESRATVASSDDIDNAIGIIAASKRPLVLAGRGAANPKSKAALLKLAERIDAPVATTLKGKDLFAGHPFNLGIMGGVSQPAAVDIIMESDCIIAFGASLNHFTLSKGTFARGKRIIEVNQSASEIGKNVAPDVGLVGDCAAVGEIILNWLDEAEIPGSGFRTPEMAERIASGFVPQIKAEDNGDGTVDFIDSLQKLDHILPDDRIYVAGCGRFMRKAWTDISATDPWSFLNTSDSGSIGFGMPYAIGVASASQGRPTILVEGDGGFMHAGLAEFNTAVRSKLDIIVAVCNDGAYGAEHMKFYARQMDTSNCRFDWPNLAPVAQSLGGEGVTVRKSSDWDLVKEAISNRKAPLLIDIKLNADLVHI